MNITGVFLHILADALGTLLFLWLHLHFTRKPLKFIWCLQPLQFCESAVICHTGYSGSEPIELGQPKINEFLVFINRQAKRLVRF